MVGHSLMVAFPPGGDRIGQRGNRLFSPARPMFLGEVAPPKKTQEPPALRQLATTQTWRTRPITPQATLEWNPKDRKGVV